MDATPEMNVINDGKDNFSRQPLAAGPSYPWSSSEAASSSERAGGNLLVCRTRPTSSARSGFAHTVWVNASKDTKNKKEEGFIRKAEYRPSLC